MPPLFPSDIGAPAPIIRPRSIAPCAAIGMTQAIVDGARPLGRTISPRAGTGMREHGRQNTVRIYSLTTYRIYSTRFAILAHGGASSRDDPEGGLLPDRDLVAEVAPHDKMRHVFQLTYIDLGGVGRQSTSPACSLS